MAHAALIRDATPADARGIARVGIESWRSAYRGLFPDALLDGMDLERSTATREAWLRSLAPGQFVLVAEDAGEIVGFCGAGPSRTPEADAEIYAVYLLPAHQRKGVGRALLRESARRLRAAGLGSLLIWVLRENASARAFYERLGGVASHEKEDVVGTTLPHGPHRVIETGYVWRDTSALVGEL